MCQKIKKKIIRSMPVFIIFSLVMSSVAVGLIFNIDLRVHFNDAKELSVGMGLSEAQAQTPDRASTTVTVLNAWPEIQDEAAEVPASTSTSPINIGNGISYTVTATDPEPNNYYLIVCSSNSVIASSTGGAPTCGVTTYCTSISTGSGAEASCTYNSVADPGAGIETVQWFAFVCDAHPTEGVCNPTPSQGAAPQNGDNSSPFYVNHAPTITAASTFNDYQDPEGIYTITASTTDPDLMGGADELYMYVCSTDAWATTTGCSAIEFCSGTSTSPDVSCNFASSTPVRDGAWQYWVFVKDWHQMPASGNFKTQYYHVNNVAPEVSNITLNGGANMIPNMKGMAEKEASTTSASISDDNSCMDIVAATSTIYWSSATSTYDCSPDDNYCYQITSVNCVADAGSCTGWGDDTMSYTCTTTIAYHALPTDGIGNPNSGTHWVGSIQVRDEALFGVGTSSAIIEMQTLNAIEIQEIEIPYGSVSGGTSTGAYHATTTVINYGNGPLDAQIEGTDMDKTDLTDIILVTSQKFDLATLGYAGLTHTLSSTTPYVLDTVIYRPTSMANVSDEVYWGIAIPGGTTSGDYEGVNTFIATLDDDSW